MYLRELLSLKFPPQEFVKMFLLVCPFTGIPVIYICLKDCCLVFLWK